MPTLPTLYMHSGSVVTAYSGYKTKIFSLDRKNAEQALANVRRNRKDYANKEAWDKQIRFYQGFLDKFDAVEKARE